MPLSRYCLLVASVVLFSVLNSSQAQSSVGATPYIDQLKATMEESGESAEGYSEKIRLDTLAREAKDPEARPSQYVEFLKSTDPDAQEIESSEGYSAKLQAEARKTPDRKSAIQSVHDGTSDLKPKFDKEASSAAGFKFMAAGSRNYAAKAGTGKRKFDQVYGSGWDPDFSFFYEHQLMRSDYFNLGVQGSLGFGIFRGDGSFEYDLTRADGQSFGKPKVSFRFITLPAHAGGRFTLTAMRYVQPYASIGPVLVAYLETRTDKKPDKWGRAFGYLGQIGANIKLDELTPEFLWDLYQGLGVRHYYLTIDYSRQSTPASSVDFDSNLVSLGFTYEF